MARLIPGVTAAAATLAVLLILATTPASGHHSFAAYEPQKQIKLAGEVTEFRWSNPHVYIRLNAPDAGGKTRQWLIECANPGILNRVGWKFNMIKVGDPLTVIASPLRNGDPAALLKQVTLADGRKFSNGGPAGRATIE